jgi:hypothetical protein
LDFDSLNLRKLLRFLDLRGAALMSVSGRLRGKARSL